MIKIAFIYPSRENATTYFRMQSPSRYFTEVEAVPYHYSTDILDDVAKFGNFIESVKEDIVLLHRASHANEQFAIAFSDAKKKIIFDTDDLEYALPRNHHLQGILDNTKTRRYITTILKHSSEAWVTVPDLKRELSKISTTPVVVIPNAIDYLNEYAWNHRNGTITSDVPVIGWVGGVSHLPDLPECKRAIKYLYDEGYKFHLKICGMPKEQIQIQRVHGQIVKREMPKEQRYEVLARKIFDFLPDDYVSFHEARPIDEYPHLYDDIDISIAPLAAGSFNNCKSELKILEAGSKKIPIVTSATRNYTYFNRRFPNTIFVAHSNFDWRRHLADLITYPDLRQLRGGLLYDVVTEHYNVSRFARIREERILELAN